MSDPTLSYLPASFNYIPFFVKNEHVHQTGRKIAIHDFINSPSRQVQDLGKSPVTISIDGFVANNVGIAQGILGGAYLEQYELLKNAVSSRITAILVTQQLGIFWATPTRDISANSSPSSSGVINFSLEFTTNTSIESPSLFGVNINQIFAGADGAREGLGNIVGRLT